MAASFPDVGDVHVNAVLTNVSVGFGNKSYIADTLFPFVYVEKQSDIYPKYDKSYWFRDEAKVRAPGAWAEETGWKYDVTNTYFANNYAIAHSIPDERRANADGWARQDRDATRLVTEKQYLRREAYWATNFFATSKWTTDKTGGSSFTKFSDYGASSPIQTVRGYITDVRQLTAERPNVWVMGDFGFDVLCDHPDFIERIKGAASPGSPAIVTPQLLASVLRLERIVIGSAMQVTTAEGVAEASATYADIFDDDSLLMFVPNGPSLDTPAAGYTFVWSSAVGGNTPQFIRRLRDDRGKKDIIESHSYWDMKITCADAGLFMSDMVD